MNFTVSANSGAKASVTANISEKDCGILRELAKKLAFLASRPIEEEKKALWYKHNKLENTRPIIFCDPENGWGEIILPEDLQCEGELARAWEIKLRMDIFWGESMGDDKVTQALFEVPYTFEETPWGVKEKVIGGGSGHSYRWEAPISDYETDFGKLKFQEILINQENTDSVLALAHEIFDGILTVVLKGKWWWSLGMTRVLIRLRGLEQFMLDMYDYPDELHKLMAFLRDGHLYKLDFLEKNNLLSLNNGGTYVGSGGFGWTDELPQPDFDGEHVRPADMWGFCESQETTLLSPDMFAEFVFPYQLPILERFGLNCYGCCEGLDKRWGTIKQIPRLRRVSVSPWADPIKMAELLGGDYIYSLKPNPAYLAIPEMDEEYIRKSLREAIDVARANNNRMEIIMKDNNTLGKNPRNATRWCEIAQEEAAKW